MLRSQDIGKIKQNTLKDGHGSPCKNVKIQNGLTFLMSYILNWCNTCRYKISVENKLILYQCFPLRYFLAINCIDFGLK